jgi:hypothetical protein
MTKKDYIRAAELIREQFGKKSDLYARLSATANGEPGGSCEIADEVCDAVVALFARLFALDNARFDLARFVAACSKE